MLSAKRGHLFPDNKLFILQKAGSYIIIFLSFRAVGKKPMVQAYSIYAINKKEI